METIFSQRMEPRYEELKQLYDEIYPGDAEAFAYFCGMLKKCLYNRKASLQILDAQRLAEPEWFRSNKLMGMMLYVNAFAGNLRGVQKKLPYLSECGVNYLHLMPLLESPKDRSDGGYAVSNFRRVQPELGTMEDLETLADQCREKGISLCLDFVMNHTSEDHAWAKAARAGDEVARSRYFFYDNWDVPNRYEQTVPQVFPTTAPGNFTWLEDCRQVVMTTFYPYQWDLNYANPMVFNDMVENMLFLANRGINVIRLDAVPYIWKELGTSCRNLPQVHTLVRIMRLACEIVCPSVLLLGEVVMEPAKVVPYFGSPEHPECHMLYNVTTMATTWHTLATQDTRLLKHQIDQISALPSDCLFQNYLRCHDDIGWGLDYPWLRQFGTEEVSHKKYLNDWFTGKWPGSPSRGELYNDDPRLGDARLCGTTASLCGMESAKTEEEVELALACDLMLHAWMLTQSGIPVLYSGDEVGQLNDNSYHDDPDKAADSRYLHRGNFDWEKAELRKDTATYQGKLFAALRKLETIRGSEPVFRSDAKMTAFDTGSVNVLGIRRDLGDEHFIGLFNFSPKNVPLLMRGENGVDLLRPEITVNTQIELPPYGFIWMKTA
ncbi:MAG: alpha-amylase family glycosyl hydrolase [Clostridiales bacterium]|nr:alpha-amylase family glycosyl hydrolase [Clostridiales bacterium]